MKDEKLTSPRNVHYYHEVYCLVHWGIIFFLAIELGMFSIFNGIPLNLQQVTTSILKISTSYEETCNRTQTLNNQFETKKYIYNLSNSRSDVYELKGDIRIDTNSSRIFVDSHDTSFWTVSPYARKIDNLKLKSIREWKIQASPNLKHFPVCQKKLTVPAILLDGSIGINYYHALADVLFPLYVTSMYFSRNVIFLISSSERWLTKFNPVFEKLTNYNVVNIDKENEVLCFSNVIVGLRADKNFGIDPLVAPHHSIRDFRKLLRNIYSLKRETIDDCYRRRPRVLIVSRRRSRRLTNGEELANMVRSMGADVALHEMEPNVLPIAQFVNSFDVMIAVHGAGVTNMIFLPDDAVLVQIVPFGAYKFAYDFYTEPARRMTLRCLEYNVTLNESSLLGKYSANSEVYTDPERILVKKGLPFFYGIYFSHQDVTIDLDRIRPTLVDALKNVVP